MERPIRPFYCVYLLRSSKRRASMYIGSTPNPRRRLKQHNNVSGKGGAHRTTRDNLQPWDMIVTIAGFPSKTAALQFEWAWQHPHLTRHLTKEERISVLTDTVKRRRGATGARRLARPSRSIQANMLNLHLLLGVDSFCRWPLRVRFFAKDVFNTWLKLSSSDAQPSHPTIPVHLDNDSAQEQPEGLSSDNSPHALRGIDALDITYASFKPHLTKSTNLLDSSTTVACARCNLHAKPERDLLLVCPNENCNMVAHVTCLAEFFLEREGRDSEILPIGGQCPSCRATLRWSDMMTELSLRLRGQDTIQTLMKEPKQTQAKQKNRRREEAAQLAPVSNVLVRGASGALQERLANLAQGRYDNNVGDDKDLNDNEFDDDDDDDFVNISDVLGEDSSEVENADKRGPSHSKANKPNLSSRLQKPSRKSRPKHIISDSEYEDIDEIV